MKYNLVTTGLGMMEPGIVVGNVEANSHEAAVKKARELVPGRVMIWDVIKEEKTNVKN